MKGLSVTSAAAVCLAATTVSANLPSFGIAAGSASRNHAAFIGLDSRGGAVEAAKKASSKKKKKKASSTTAAATSSSGSKKKKKSTKTPAEQHKENSQAILAASTKNSLSVFSYDANDGHTVVGMTESAMEHLGIFDGDTVSIKGKRGRKTMATVAMIPDSDISALDASVTKMADNGTYHGAIGMTQDAMKNSGVRAGDGVTVTPAPDVKFGKAVLILPYGDSAEEAGVDLTNEEDSDDLFETYLKPYFESKFRTLHRGDSFHIDGPKGLIEFQCVEIDSVEVDGDSACVVVDDTLIECEGEPIDRDDADDLADAGYDAIGGASSHLAAVRELVELPLKHPELWGKLGINTPRGVLLTGPSGCGKTAMARAVAAETGAYFFVINGPEVISKRAGESETNLRRAFEDAEANSADYNGAIIFIDEIDSIAPRRDKAGGEVEKRIVSQLLTLMDGLKPMSKVIVIAASNRPQVIEPALRRPGRFDRELDMGIPDEQGRLEILQIKTRDMRLGQDVDL